MTIEINFLELENQDFEFCVYIRPYFDSQKSDFYVVSLSKENKDISLENDSRQKFEVSYYSMLGFIERYVSSKENHFLTTWYISQKINENKKSFNITKVDSFSKNSPVFYVNSENLKEGSREVTLRPFYYKNLKLFGFIYGFHYKKEKLDEKLTKLDLINSFSLDVNGKSNKEQSYDVRKYLSSNFKRLIIPILSSINFNVKVKLLVVDNKDLYKVEYLGEKGVSNKSFLSVRNNGCYKNTSVSCFTFVFLERDRQFARDIYYALKGETFPEQFSGMKNMFNISLEKNNVNFLVLSDFEINENSDLISRIRSNSCGFLIFCLFSKDEDCVSNFYLSIKLECLRGNIPSQFLYKQKFLNKELLRWSISNIGLQVFAKAGGVPWAVRCSKNNEINKSIIIGIGTSHALDDQGNIKKYFAYAICSDSLGIFKFALPIAVSSSEQGYYNALDVGISELKNFIDRDTYKYVSIHMTENIKISEAKNLEVKIRNYFDNMNLFILKINRHHDFIGFSMTNHTVVSAGAFVKLSFSQYLIWTDGVDNMQIPNRRYASPLLVEFRFPEKNSLATVNKDIIMSVLQDIYILSLANWRGFNAEATPITLVYSKLIANFIKNIKNLPSNNDELVFPKTDLPWFL
ncbi:hypothetical protein FK216_10210 [Moraxellaceae bacterium AER2_44_116]|nr:hypothetical protein [Moraxellaceae bacterium]TQC97258.1 hypothetical protein FK216_10210 [Moraxellaceae bacterium AER2_44_116]